VVAHTNFKCRLSGYGAKIKNYDEDACLREIRGLGTHDIAIIDGAGKKPFEASLPSLVAESIIRSVLWGRSEFSLSSDAKIMNRALSEFLKWVVQIEKNVSTAIAESALGTGYEDALRREIYARLGIHPLASVATLPTQINLVAPAIAG
jgi:hypothetical protein